MGIHEQVIATLEGTCPPDDEIVVVEEIMGNGFYVTRAEASFLMTKLEMHIDEETGIYMLHEDDDTEKVEPLLEEFRNSKKED